MNDNNERLISVIVPVYNIEEYIEKCILSIIKQTYRDLEIILVDDGSSDSSGKICDKYAEKDNRIIVIHKDNGGLSDARNCALDIAKGEYIGFVDGDDWIHSQMYEILIYAIEKHNAGISSCCFTHNEKEMNNKYTLSGIKTFLFSKTDCFIDTGKTLVTACNKLYKKSVFDHVRYPLGMLHEDEYIFAETLYWAETVATVDLPLYFYSQREGSIVSRMNLKRLNDCLEAFEHRVEYVEQVKWDEVIRNAVIQYCDYNIFIYQKIKSGDYPQLNSSLCKMIWKNVKTKTLQYGPLRIGKRYRLFASSPSLFFAWKKINDFKEKNNIIKYESGILLKLIRLRMSKKKRIVFIGEPIHGNAGDHLIAQSIMDYCREYLCEWRIIDFSLSYFKTNYDYLIKSVVPDDMVFISGGGWLGSDWPDDEKFVRRMISDLPNNRIVVFPQTIFYDDNHIPDPVDVEMYNKHNNLLLCVREQSSLETAMNILGMKRDRIFLMPDFAILYNTDISVSCGDKVGVCFRKDREKLVADDLVCEVMHSIDNLGKITVQIETNEKTRTIRLKNSRKYIDEKLSDISKCKLLITDRLHAMIMCWLVGTPCIAFDNSTHKVKGVYEWISNADYICFADQHNFSNRMIEDMLNVKVHKVDIPNKKYYLNELKRKILEK